MDWFKTIMMWSYEKIEKRATTQYRQSFDQVFYLKPKTFTRRIYFSRQSNKVGVTTQNFDKNYTLPDSDDNVQFCIIYFTVDRKNENSCTM